MRASLTAIVVFGLSLTGCLSSSTGYKLARESVRERTGYDVPEGDTDALARQILSKPLTADAAARLALANSAQVEATLAGVGVARGEMMHALRLPNPSAELSAHVHTGGNLDIEVHATIDLVDLLLVPARGSVASDKLDAAALEAAGMLLDVAFGARVSFYEYQASAQILELRKTIVYATAQSADIARKLAEAGNVPELDALNEQALYEEARLGLARAEVDEAVKRERLNAAMGIHSARGASWTIEGRLPAPTAFDVERIEARALAASLDLKALKLRYGAASVQSDLAWAEGFLPGIDAGVMMEHEDAEGDVGVGPRIGVTLPLFYQGQGEVAVAEAEMARAKGGAVVTATRIRSAARALAVQLSGAKKSAEFYMSTMLPLRDKIVEETLKKYNAMDTGPFQVLQAKRDQIETARGYVETLRDYWVTRAQIELLLAGRLSSMPGGLTASPGGSPGRGEDH